MGGPSVSSGWSSGSHCGGVSGDRPPIAIPSSGVGNGGLVRSSGGASGSVGKFRRSPALPRALPLPPRLCSLVLVLGPLPEGACAGPPCASPSLRLTQSRWLFQLKGRVPAL